MSTLYAILEDGRLHYSNAQADSWKHIPTSMDWMLLKVQDPTDHEKDLETPFIYRLPPLPPTPSPFLGKPFVAVQPVLF